MLNNIQITEGDSNQVVSCVHFLQPVHYYVAFRSYHTLSWVSIYSDAQLGAIEYRIIPLCCLLSQKIAPVYLESKETSLKIKRKNHIHLYLCSVKDDRYQIHIARPNFLHHLLIETFFFSGKMNC